MAAAQAATFPRSVEVEQDTAAERRAAMNSALGTMTAEGETPSDFTLALTERYIAGEIEFEELKTAVFDRAFRMAHEASLGHASR